MSDAIVLNEVPITANEIKAELEKIKKRDKELNFRANKTEEYINQLELTTKDKEIESELTKLNIPRLKEQHIKKIIDLMPKSVEEMKIVLQGYPISINNENLKKIADTVKKFE